MGLGLVSRVSNAVADPGIDGRGAREEGLGGLPPGIFRVSNAVADPGIDGRGRERGSPQKLKRRVKVLNSSSNL